MSDNFRKKESNVEILNEHLTKYLSEADIPNFIRSELWPGELLHYPVIIRNLEETKNPFTDQKPKCLHCVELPKNSGIIKDAQCKVVQLYGSYVLGYNAASRSLSSYESFKKSIAVLSQLMILDLQEKLATHNKIIGLITGEFSDLDNAAGYLLSIEANVSGTPNQIIYANIEDPENYKQFNLHKSWTKK